MSIEVAAEGGGVVAVRALVGLAAGVHGAHVGGHAGLEHHLGADGAGDLHAVLLVQLHVPLHVLCHLNTNQCLRLASKFDHRPIIFSNGSCFSPTVEPMTYYFFWYQPFDLLFFCTVGHRNEQFPSTKVA